MEEEKKQRKKQKEKERIEKMKKEGTYLTKKEKQDKARALQMLEQMKAAGTLSLYPQMCFQILVYSMFRVLVCILVSRVLNMSCSISISPVG